MSTMRSSTISALIIAGYALILVATTGLGWLAISSMERLRGIAKDLCEHSFAASNAASDMKIALTQLRNDVIQIAIMRDGGDDQRRVVDDAAALAARAREDFAVIRANFVADAAKMDQLKLKLDEWDIVRAEIFAAAARGDYAAAENFVRNVGTPKFSEVAQLADHVRVVSLERGEAYADEAGEYSARIAAELRVVIVALGVFILATGFAVVRRVRLLYAELARLAVTDSLTGVPNRGYFMELAGRELARSGRYGSPFAFAIADLDLFKAINDTHGHQAGDQVLRKFIDVVRQTLRDADVVGRIGGEEFAILLPNTALDEAREVLERVRSAIEQAGVDAGAASSPRFTASFGVTVYAGDKDVSSLLKRADEALYEAKHEGRNRVCVK